MEASDAPAGGIFLDYLTIPPGDKRLPGAATETGANHKDIMYNFDLKKIIMKYPG
jgi:hypothetical protein